MLKRTFVYDFSFCLLYCVCVFFGGGEINYISPDKARKGVIYPLKTGIYALVGISESTFTR